MTASSRDRISVDLRGLKAALFERSQAQGQTPSDFVRAALVTALQADMSVTRHLPALPGPRVRLSLRMLAGVNYLGRSTTTILAGQARGNCR